MELTGERYLPQMNGIIQLEHLSRYYFVVNQFDLKNKIVVDLASGEGYGSNILADFAQEVKGVDISNEAVVHATQNYIKKNLEFKQGEASKIPLPDNFADIFVSFETIEHHDKHEEMMREIKRVLKPDGILVMSSPDKFYYSDEQGFHNEFHIKELYYEEFKSLLNRYFKFNTFFLQQNFSGSIITVDDYNCENEIATVSDKNGNVQILQPKYNIAIGSDNQIDTELKTKHFFLGETDQILTNNDIEFAKYNERLTLEYQLGRKILKRFGLFRNIIRKFVFRGDQKSK